MNNVDFTVSLPAQKFFPSATAYLSLANEAVAFFAQVDFAPPRIMAGMPKVFRIFGGCGTRPFCSSKKDSNILAARHT